MEKIMGIAKSFIRDEEGATVVEYGVLVALVVAVCVAVIAVVGEKMNNAFEEVNKAVNK